MRHPKQPGSVLRWTCTTLVVLLTTAWLLSGWFVLGWFDGKAPITGCGLGGGRAVVSWHIGVSAERGWLFTRAGGLRWGWDVEWNSVRRFVAVPLWAPLSPLVALTATLWWRRHWTVKHSARLECRGCGYDRRGLAGGADAKCPECGTVPSSR